MAITKQRKTEIVSKLKKAISGASSLVFVNFHGLPVGETTKLRKALKEKAVGYTVSKKTLIGKVLGDAGFSGEIPPLEGEVALAYGEDALSPAREIYNFHKDHKDTLKIIGGVFGGKFMDAQAMLSIATIPPKEVLIAQFVNLINSPIARLAVALGEIAKKKEAVN